jgi:hypothetical protein
LLHCECLILDYIYQMMIRNSSAPGTTEATGRPLAVGSS